jgi:NAD(P)-dependent dehydrogenase (short-subunit alcohol dehydrogenase family)
MSLQGKKIIVTGAASGIGAETAKALKAQGAWVIGMDRNEATENIDQYISVDLSNPESITAAIAGLPQGIDGLVNSAGVPPTAGVVPVMKVNVLGLQALTAAVVEVMNDGGSIVNVTSLAGGGWAAATDQITRFQQDADFDNVESVCEQLGVDDQRGYFFSKEVLIVWTMQNRWTWRDRGIRMNCVSPGPVDTPILADFLESLGERAKLNRLLMDRYGEATDIAPVIAFLCSDSSAWIRGTNIPCDGGMLSHMQCENNGLN